MDFLPWKRVALKDQSYYRDGESGTYTPHQEVDMLDRGSMSPPPAILEPEFCPKRAGKGELTKEHSVSVENFTELGKLENSHLGVVALNEGYRAYSDSQLAPAATGSTESVGNNNQPPPSPSFSSSSNPFSFKTIKLSAAKLHMKSLFGQVKLDIERERDIVEVRMKLNKSLDLQ